jgi:hypothetical protein
MSNEYKCLIKEDYKFLWWRWTNKRYVHLWKYIDKENRKCTRCGRYELLFETHYYNGRLIEDWRETA